MERVPEPPDVPLTDIERQVLEGLAARESAADPGFARRLRGHPVRLAGTVPWLVVGALAAVGVALLLVPGVFVLAAIATLVLVVAPVALIAWALGQGDPRGRR